MSENCQVVTPENFEALFLEHSKQYPVLVVFYAPSYPESVEVLANVEQVSEQFKDKMIFSKVDCEVNPQIAQQFNVKNLPTVVIVKDAQPVDGFTQMADQEKITQFIQMQLPKEWEQAFAKAKELMQTSDFQSALELLATALPESENRHDIKMCYVQCLLETNELTQASEILNKVEFVQQDEHYKQLMSLLEVKLQAQDSPEIQAVKAQYEQNPNDSEVIKNYSAKLSEIGKHEEALSVLYEYMLKNRADTEVRPLYIDIIKMANAKVAAEFQRKLYTLLY